VHLEDFAHEGHRRLAEIYWNHQRDEGEPVFNEFLGSLGEPALAEIAMLAVDEVEALDDPDRVLSEALAWLEHRRRVQEEQKLLAALRRSSDGASDNNDIELLKVLTESRRRPDLHRA
jgi:hypothetical protein